MEQTSPHNALNNSFGATFVFSPTSQQTKPSPTFRERKHFELPDETYKSLDRLLKSINSKMAIIEQENTYQFLRSQALRIAQSINCTATLETSEKSIQKTLEQLIGIVLEQIESLKNRNSQMVLQMRAGKDEIKILQVKVMSLEKQDHLGQLISFYDGFVKQLVQKDSEQPETPIDLTFLNDESLILKVSQQANQLRQVHAFHFELEQQFLQSQLELEQLQSMKLKSSIDGSMMLKLLDSQGSSQLKSRAPSPSLVFKSQESDKCMNSQRLPQSLLSCLQSQKSQDKKLQYQSTQIKNLRLKKDLPPQTKDHQPAACSLVTTEKDSEFSSNQKRTAPNTLLELSGSKSARTLKQTLQMTQTSYRLSLNQFDSN